MALPYRASASDRALREGSARALASLASNPAALARMRARGWRLLPYRSDYDGTGRIGFRAPGGKHPAGLDWPSGTRAAGALVLAWSESYAAALALGAAPVPHPSRPRRERAPERARIEPATRESLERLGRAADRERAARWPSAPEDPEPPEHAGSLYGRAARQPSAPDRLAEDWRAAARERARRFRPERRPLPEPERGAILLALGTSEPAGRSLARMLAPLACLESAAGLGGAPLAAPLWDRIERASESCRYAAESNPERKRGRAAALALALYGAAQRSADRIGALRVALYALAEALPVDRPERYTAALGRYHAAASAWDAVETAYADASEALAALGTDPESLPDCGPRPSALRAIERMRRAPRVASLRARAESADDCGAATLRACRADPETGPLSDARPWIERAARIRGALARYLAPEQPAERAARAYADAAETLAPAAGGAYWTAQALDPIERAWYGVGNPHKGPGALRRARAECERFRADNPLGRAVRLALILETYAARERSGGR